MKSDFFSDKLCCASTTRGALRFGMAAAVALNVGLPAGAQTAQDSGSARINLASKIRYETQNIVRNACFVVNEFGNPEITKAELAKSRDTLQDLLGALENGDKALGISDAETNSRILSSLQKLDKSWLPMAADVNDILSGNQPDSAFRSLIAGDEDLLAKAGGLLAVMGGVYANNETFPRAATLAVDIAVRQQMFLSQMERFQCLIATGDAEYADSAAKLDELANLFELSLNALMKGEPSVGLIAPPTEQIETALKEASTLWAEYRPMLKDGLHAGDGSVKKAHDSLVRLNKSLQNLQIVYILGTSNQPDIYRVPLEVYAHDELARWLLDPQLILSVREQNTTNAELEQAAIDALDLEWRKEVKENGGELISEMMSRPLSGVLKQAQAHTAGMITEVFVMDDKGLNVGQSAVTSDLWQGDEAKWQEVFPADGLDMHVSDVEFDASTGFYQVQVSMPVSDPISQTHIGAITFGVNVQPLF